MTAPVTCVITCYNDAGTLEATLTSVLRQTLPVAEIIIADDGSTDGSRDLIATLALAHPVITPVLRDSNLGVAANRDLAIRAAAQPFVTHLDGDDFFARGKIEAEWCALNGRMDAVAYSLVALVYQGKFWRTRVLNPSETVGANDRAFDHLLTRSGAIPRDMLLSKTLFETVGGFTHGVPLYEDWEFKLRLARHGVDWVGSGALGTLYMQHDRGLASAEKVRHEEWKNRISSAMGARTIASPMTDHRRGRLMRFAQIIRHFPNIRNTVRFHRIEHQ